MLAMIGAIAREREVSDDLKGRDATKHSEGEL